MTAIGREAMLENILFYLDVPQLSASHQVGLGIGPSDQTFFERHNLNQSERETAVLEELQSMTDDEVSKLYDEPDAKELFAIQRGLGEAPEWYSGGFSVRGFEPDWNVWKMMDFWTLEETTCLSIGFTPQTMPPDTNRRYDPSAPRQFFWARQEIIRRSGCLDPRRPDAIRPKLFADWCIKKGLPVPDDLLQSVGSGSSKQSGMLKTVDARQHDSALKVILGFLAGTFGDEGDQASQLAREDIELGLGKIGLGFDRKTLKKTLAEATTSLPRFLEEQAKRDG